MPQHLKDTLEILLVRQSSHILDYGLLVLQGIIQDHIRGYGMSIGFLDLSLVLCSGIIGVAKHPNCLSLLLIIIVCIRVLFSFEIDHNSLYAGFFFCLFGYIFYFNSRIIA